MSNASPTEERGTAQPTGGSPDAGSNTNTQLVAASTSAGNLEGEADAASAARKPTDTTGALSRKAKKARARAAREASSSRAEATSGTESSSAAATATTSPPIQLQPADAGSELEAPATKSLPDANDPTQIPLPEGDSSSQEVSPTNVESAPQEQPAPDETRSAEAVVEYGSESAEVKRMKKKEELPFERHLRRKKLYWELALYLLSIAIFLLRTRLAFFETPHYTIFALLQLLWQLGATFYYIRSGLVRLLIRDLDKSIASSSSGPAAARKFWKETNHSLHWTMPRKKRIAKLVTATGVLLHIASIPYIGKLVPSVPLDDNGVAAWYVRLGRRSAPVEHLFETKSRFRGLQDRSASILELSGTIMDECSALKYGDVLLDQNIFGDEPPSSSSPFFDASLLLLLLPSSRSQLARSPALLQLRSALSVFEGPPANIKPRDVQAPDQITELQNALLRISRNHTERIRLFEAEVLAVDKARRLGSFFLPLFASHAWEGKARRSAHAKWNALAAFYAAARADVHELRAEAHFRHSLLSAAFAANRRLQADRLWLAATAWQGRLLWLRWRLWQLRSAARLLRLRLSRDPAKRARYRALPPTSRPYSPAAPPRLPFGRLRPWERRLDSVVALSRDISRCEAATTALRAAAKELWDDLPDAAELERLRDAMVRLEVPDAPAWPWGAEGGAGGVGGGESAPLLHALAAVERQLPGWRYALMTWTGGPDEEREEEVGEV